MKLRGRATSLRIYIGDHDTWNGQPLYEAIVARALGMGMAGATAYRGIVGYGAHQHLYGAKALAHDAPIVIEIVDIAARIDALLLALEEMVKVGCTMTLTDVTVVRHTSPGETPGA